jgi:hypothetical protein
MADEHDSWFQPFGFDPGEAAAKAMAAARAQAEALQAQAEQAIREKVAAAERFVEKPIDTVVDGAKKVIKKIEDGASGAAKAVGGIVSPGPKSAPAGGSGPPGSVSGLGGSVGAGGKNNPDDVRAVQAALGIDVDGQCGGGTIAAIKAFQKSIGMGNPDGRIDVGGRTAAALAGGGGGKAAAGDDAPSGALASATGILSGAFDSAAGALSVLGDALAGALNSGGSIPGHPVAEVSAADFAARLAQWKKCVGNCKEQFEACVKRSNNAQECLAALTACLRRCPPEPVPPPEPPPTPKTTCTLPHPTGLVTTGRTGGISYGFKTALTWKSTSGNLADLKDCEVSEHITYSKIPNPPYGLPNGTPVAESGRAERKKPFPATAGRLQDTHRAPSEWVGNPPRSEGSFTVTQTYDYKCPGCGGAWIPFAHYVIKYEVRQEAGEWVHVTTKVGDGEQKGESLDITESIR